ncbi:MAG: hypothetical protein FRX48_03539 [Lasallia pustulata]|uniref:Uncharacterized protein n=1 Tax=Lasallia pustulata TaxID=136370 RepID=A0A5M8PSK3_9LECA|nr:MAG: hypothetical protein FRX48_03539 [Lasallia pustulata]
MSLFGNPGASTASTQPSQPAQSGNLFGNLASSQLQQQPSLFSNLGGQSKPQASSAPFGALGLGGQQASSGGIGTRAVGGGGGGGLFGAPMTTTSQPSSTLFGQQNNTSSQPLASSFANPQAQQPQQQNQLGQSQPAQPQDGQQSGGLRAPAQPAYFDSLLEKGKRRSVAANGRADLWEVPDLQLGLEDIARKVRELGGTASQPTGERGADTRAHYLLAASGINPGSTLKDLNSLNTYRSTANNLQQPTDWDPDSSKYVNQLQQQSTLKMIDDGLKRAQRDFDAYLEEHVDINWEEQRKKIYEHFGLEARGTNSPSYDPITYPSLGGSGSFSRSSQKGRRSTVTRPGHATPNRSVFGHSGMQKSVIGTPGVGSGNATLFADVADKNGTGPGVQDDRSLREKQGKNLRMLRANLVESLPVNSLRPTRL